MKCLLRISFLLVIISYFSLSYPDITIAAVDLPWSTTYDCNDWTQSDGLSIGDVNCDGISGAGGWTTSDGKEEQITVDANNPNGVGKGQRHWVGDGLNNNSGGLSLEFNSPQSEFWIRWTLRFENGFKWSSQEGFKLLYLYDTNIRGYAYFLISYGDDTLSLYTQLGDRIHYKCNNCGWLTLFPSGISDGTWHTFELHLKREIAGQSNGVFQAWLDGNLVINDSSVDYGLADNGLLFKEILIGSNAKYPSNGRSMSVDYDDIAISNTGYIGPLPDTISPSPPEITN